jgi:dTDP-4-amino-4,6-dideoxygalactose transaminase
VRVPFNGLGKQYARLKGAIEPAVQRVLASGWYVGGPEVEAFEAAFAKEAGLAHVAGVANGTDAIALALRALGVQHGDEVIVPGLSAYPTVVGVQQAGALPVFADVGADGLLDVQAARRAIGPRTRAVMPVHLYGNVADLAALKRLCDERGLLLVEDCAQAHGASRDGAGAGSVGAAAAFSFYPTKNLGAAGDAGAVASASAEVDAHLRRLRNYGQRTRYLHEEPGVNSRLDPLQAAILAAKLPHLEEENGKRRAIAALYDSALTGSGAEPLLVPEGCTPSRHLYPVRLRGPAAREPFVARLAEAGVETLIHYPHAMPDQPAADRSWRGGETCVNARALAATVVSLPLYPDLTEEQSGWVAESVLRALQPR